MTKITATKITAALQELPLPAPAEATTVEELR
jgi:hypothetical protein